MIFSFVSGGGGIRMVVLEFIHIFVFFVLQCFIMVDITDDSDVVDPWAESDA